MVVITATSSDVCASVITTATIKAPCISQSKSSPLAGSSCLGESLPEESLRGCRLPRKQEFPLGNPSGCWPRTPPPTRAPPKGDDLALRFRVPGHGSAPPSTRWDRPAPWLGRPAIGFAALHRGPWRGWAGDMANTTVSGTSAGAGAVWWELWTGGWVGARGLVPSVLFQSRQRCSFAFTRKAHHCPEKAWEIRSQMAHLWEEKDNFRAAWARREHGTPSRDCGRNLSNLWFAYWREACLGLALHSSFPTKRIRSEIKA